jgi:protein-disulfide isomerase
MNQKTVFLLLAGLLALGFAAAVVLYKQAEPAGQAGGWGQGDVVFERPGAPVKGAEDARVTIVEFLDPACGTCAQFFPLVRQIVEQSGGRVRVMARYAPLHEGSEQVVKMLEAAHRQGKFWQALELLFANQNRWVSNHRANPLWARSLMNSIAMDHARLDADLASAEVAEAVARDVRDGAALSVKATPEFFVNGKSMPSFGYRQLQQLVDDAVAKNY